MPFRPLFLLSLAFGVLLAATGCTFGLAADGDAPSVSVGWLAADGPPVVLAASFAVDEAVLFAPAPDGLPAPTDLAPQPAKDEQLDVDDLTRCREVLRSVSTESFDRLRQPALLPRGSVILGDRGRSRAGPA